MKRKLIVVLLALSATAAGALARQVKDGGDIENVKTFDVTASRFLFEPATITVVKGDSVGSGSSLPIVPTPSRSKRSG